MGKILINGYFYCTYTIWASFNFIATAISNLPVYKTYLDKFLMFLVYAELV